MPLIIRSENCLHVFCVYSWCREYFETSVLCLLVVFNAEYGLYSVY